MNKICKHCQVEKPYSEFHKNSKAKDGCVNYCKACCSKADIELRHLRKTAPEKIPDWWNANRVRDRIVVGQTLRGYVVVGIVKLTQHASTTVLRLQCKGGCIRNCIESFLRKRKGWCNDCHNKYHGMQRSGEYKSWQKMKERCSNPNHKGFHRYGGRGIKVCNRWEDSFHAFFEDMGRRPSRDYSIERINNDGNYEPENCKWATRKEQALNTSQVRILEYDGVRTSLSEHARRAGISSYTVSLRIKKGWSVGRALTTPSRQSKFPETARAK